MSSNFGRPSDSLVQALITSPNDVRLRERCARALERDGLREAAVDVLLSKFINLTAHEEGALPCLCTRCLDRVHDRASAEGVTFRREFAVDGGKVLFFWLPDELVADRGRVRQSVVGALTHARLRRSHRL